MDIHKDDTHTRPSDQCESDAEASVWTLQVEYKYFYSKSAKRIEIISLRKQFKLVPLHLISFSSFGIHLSTF